jgi:hypothetical protein
VIGAAILSALSNASSSSANTHWDINGTTPDSGVVNQTPDWLNGTVPNKGTWNGTITNWNSDPTGGSAGALTGDPGSDTGVFSAGTDAAGKTYFAVVPDGGSVTAGGLAVGANQGTIIIPGYGNAGAGGRGSLPDGGGTANSFLNVGSGTFNVDVATGSALHLGFRLALMSPNGSATITKTGGGLFNNVTYVKPDLNPFFTGKWDVQDGTFGIFFGGNTMLGESTTAFVPDQLKVSNNAVIEAFQQGSSTTINANTGITIGAGGGTIFFAGAKALDPGINYASLGLTNFSSKITGGSEGARVPITLMSNIVSPTLSGAGQAAGGIMAGFADNSTTLYAKELPPQCQLHH